MMDAAVPSSMQYHLSLILERKCKQKISLW
jgi:hypothetical protein